MKFDQLAIACAGAATQERLARNMTAEFGADFSAQDFVRTEGLNVYGEPIWNTALLMFDYKTWPMEYELLRYAEGWNWHNYVRRCEPTGADHWVSHYGVHIDCAADNKRFRDKYEVLQEVVTVSHTNDYVLSRDRRYHYVIYNAQRDLGCELKTILRLSSAEATEQLVRWGLRA